MNFAKFKNKRPAPVIVRLGRYDAVRRHWSELKMKPAKALAAAAGDLKTVRAMVNEDNALDTVRWSTRRQRQSTTVIIRWSMSCSMPAPIH